MRVRTPGRVLPPPFDRPLASLTQVPEIHRAILETLEKNHAPPDIDIIYGSAHWANAILEGKIDEMTEDCPRGCPHDSSAIDCELDLAIEDGRLPVERLASFRRMERAFA